MSTKRDYTTAKCQKHGMRKSGPISYMLYTSSAPQSRGQCAFLELRCRGGSASSRRVAAGRLPLVWWMLCPIISADAYQRGELPRATMERRQRRKKFTNTWAAEDDHKLHVCTKPALTIPSAFFATSMTPTLHRFWCFFDHKWHVPGKDSGKVFLFCFQEIGIWLLTFACTQVRLTKKQTLCVR